MIAVSDPSCRPVVWWRWGNQVGGGCCDEWCDVRGRERLASVPFQDARVRPVLRHGWIRAWAHAPGWRYFQVIADRREYPSDLSDARWELIEPVLSAWRYERHGRALGFAVPPSSICARL